MERVEINSFDDLYNALDRLNGSIDWDTFYSKRTMPAPFLVNNTLPDKAVAAFIKTHGVKTAIEFGCGEGRNAVCLAENGVDVTGVDASAVAIKNAKEKSGDKKNIRFLCGDFLSVDPYERKYELALDSGMFHHLAPHRRLQYRDLLKNILAENGYFILLCFAADAGETEDLDDLQFYSKRNTGVSFSEQRIRSFFGPVFDILSIEPSGRELTDEYIDIPGLYFCVMRLRRNQTTERVRSGEEIMVRKAKPEDAGVLATLAVRMWTDNDPVILEEEFRELTQNDEAACFIKYVGEEPVAFAQCQLRHDYVEGTGSSPVGYLEGVFVSEGYRGNGYASELLAASENWAREKGCTEFASDCELDNADSLRFHLATGFEEANRIICFKKRL